MVNVFTDEPERANVLLDGDRIAGVGDYSDGDADITEDVSGKVICPGFADGHIHLESTMLRPSQFARVCLPHGTTSVIADPHEIADISGGMGIRCLLAAGEGSDRRSCGKAPEKLQKMHRAQEFSCAWLRHMIQLQYTPMKGRNTCHAGSF